MSDFSIMPSSDQTIPFSGSNTDPAALGLSNPDSILGGTMRSTQNVGVGGPQIDSANNRILLTNPIDGSSVGIGTIPGSTTGEFGFFSLDSNNNVVMKIVNGVQSFYDSKNNLIQKIQAGTTYIYDPSNNYVNVTQSGLLPDGSGGFVVAKPAINVADVFS